MGAPPAATAIVAACAPAEPALSLELTDNAITAERGSVPTGHLVFLIHNAGTSVHELEVVRAGAVGDELAYDSARAQVADEEIASGHEVDREPLGRADENGLPLGDDVLGDDLPGHYAAGMRLALEAR